VRAAPAGTLCLEVDKCLETLAQEERQDVVAVHPLVRRDVDLDAVAQPEQLLDPPPLEHERVERAEQRPPVHATRHCGVPVQVRRAAPALDHDREEDARLDELRDGGRRASRRDPEVVGEASQRADAVRARGDLDERAHRIGVGGPRPCEHLDRQDPLGEVVAALEGRVAPCWGDLTGEEEELQDTLGGRPVPAPSGAGTRMLRLVERLHLARGHGPVGRHERADLDDELRVLQRDVTDDAPRGGEVVAPSPAEQRVRRGRDVRRLVSPCLDEATGCVPGGAVEQGGVVRADPREDRHQVRAGEHVHRVDLQQADTVDDLLELAHRRRCRPDGARTVEALCAQGDPAGLGERQGRRRERHAVILPDATDTPSHRRPSSTARRPVGRRAVLLGDAARVQRAATALSWPPGRATGVSSLITP
jgi:hypothetical protein